MWIRLRQPLTAIGAFALVGVVAGVLWWWWWTPPVAVVSDGVLLLDGAGLRAQFSATAAYVLGAASTGLVLGLMLTTLLERDELATLIGVGVGSAVGGWLMMVVGTGLGPDDPLPRAETLADLTEVQLNLTIPLVALLATPIGALSAALIVLLGITRRDSRRRDPGFDGQPEESTASTA